MRSAAFALFALLAIFIPLSNVAVVRAEPPAVAGMPPAAPPANAAKLDTHLAGWEKASAAWTNFAVEVKLTRKDGVRQKTQEYSGSALCMTPTFARLRLEYTADPKDYEAFICDGKAVYAYSGLSKTVTQHKLPDPKTDPNGATDNLVLDFLFGFKAKVLKDRFAVQFLGEDPDYVYLSIKPTQARDRQEFDELRLALHGPQTKTKAPYLPAQIIIAKPNGDSEDWKFTKPRIDNAGISAKDFQFVEVKGFTLQKAPRQP